ncbi:hypothetical protein CDD83_1715 [Cordyceps sp. RAO-2017]|nr:hypothetical protein CDD83_1715 [Cordyceps sp. RAO-2017]
MADQEHYNARGTASHSRSIGITQRATPLTLTWTGDQRVRFTDFQVNEIAPDGTVVHLHKIGLGPGQKQEKPSQEAPVHKPETTHSENGTDSVTKRVEPGQEGPATEPKTEVPAEDVAALSSLAGDKFAQDLVNLFQGADGEPGEKPTSVVSEPVSDKSKRGQIHGEVRRIFRSTIETSTDDAGAIIAVRASSRKGRRRNRGARDQVEDKPTGEYLHFTLYKDNRDTMDAVNQVARILRIKPQIIGYAGTKDRRASTAQRCSIRYMRQRALAGANNKLRGIVTGDYEYSDERVHLGRLLGNEFVIVIKNCKVVGQPAELSPAELSPAESFEALKTHVQAALDHMTAHGWINYFGHQRFGTHQIGTHEVGKLIIGEKWREAVTALLSYDEEIASKAAGGEVPTDATKRDEYARHHACMLFRTGQDVEKAARIMPSRFAAETCILRHLTRLGSGSLADYPGALTHITRGLRSMYLHAYQSHVWNHAASRRWELHGAKVVAGDLVLVEGEAASAGQDQDGDDIVNPTTGEDDDEARLRARPLTEEEASGGRWTIDDVVLPSPGYDVVYPANELGRFYEDFMGRADNGGLDPHRMRRLRREFSLPGRYRKLMARFLAAPSADVRPYADDAQQMHPTDLDRVRAAAGKKRRRDGDGDDDDDGVPAGSNGSKRAKIDDDAHRPPPEDGAAAPPPPSKTAVIVKFQLGSSAYATVALRELMGDLPAPEPSGSGTEAGAAAT